MENYQSLINYIFCLINLICCGFDPQQAPKIVAPNDNASFIKFINSLSEYMV